MDKILIVEDKRITYTAFKLFLESCGYYVYPFTDTAEEALEILKGDDLPTLVVLDIELAGDLSGIAVGRALAEHSEAIPYIYLSDRIELTNQAQSTGSFAFLEKPFSAEELEEKIRELLSALQKIKGKMGNKPPETSEWFVFQKIQEKVKIRFADVVFVELYNRKYTRLHLQNGEVHVQKDSLSAFLEVLDEKYPSRPLVRIHSAYIVNQERISRIKGKSRTYKIILEGSTEEVPVGRNYEANLPEWFDS
ncbi:MAG: response regulator transcription factor [Bacteroidota bacterium]